MAPGLIFFLVPALSPMTSQGLEECQHAGSKERERKPADTYDLLFSRTEASWIGGGVAAQVATFLLWSASSPKILYIDN